MIGLAVEAGGEMEYLLSGVGELAGSRRLTQLVGKRSVMLGARYGQPHHRHLMPYNPNEQSREDRRAENDPERRLRRIAARRLVGEPAGEKFEMFLDEGEIGLGPHRPAAMLEGIPVSHARYCRTGLPHR